MAIGTAQAFSSQTIHVLRGINYFRYDYVGTHTQHHHAGNTEMVAYESW
jgi:hypothetical protein